MKKKLVIIVMSIYLALTLAAYIAVLNGPPDGLANLPLVIVNLPLIIVERALTNMIYGSMDGYLWKPLVNAMGVPRGYYFSQLYWFLPITILQTFLFFSLAKWIKNKS